MSEGCAGSDNPTQMIVNLTTEPFVRAQLPGRLRHQTQDGRYLVTEQVEIEELRYQSQLWELRPTGIARLADARTGRAVMSRDGSTVAVYRPLIVDPTTSAVGVWRLRPGIGAAEVLPGSLGVRAIAFGAGRDLFGVGSGSATAWDLDRTLYTSDYKIPRPADVPECVEAGNPNPFRLRTAGGPGGALARSDDARTVAIFARSTSHALDLGLAPNEQIGELSWSRDGQLLLVHVEGLENKCATGSNRGTIAVRVLEASGAPLNIPVVAARLPERLLSTSETPSRLLFQAPGSTLVVRDGTDLEQIARFDGSALSTTTGVSVHALERQGGGRVAGTNSSGRVIVWDADDGRVLNDLSMGVVQPTARLDFIGVAFRPGTDELAVKTVDQRIGIFTLSTGSRRVERQVPPEAAARLTYSPDGSLLVLDGGFLYDHDLERMGGRLWPAAWDRLTSDAGSESTRFERGVFGSLYLIIERTDDTEAARWRVDPAGLRLLACGQAGRNLTQAEASLFGVAPPPHKTCPNS
jgi:hypothetical protein